MNRLKKERVNFILQKTFFNPDRNLSAQIAEQSHVFNVIFELEDQLDDYLADEDRLDILMDLGHLYKVISKPSEAIHYYSEYLRNVPDDPKKQITAFISLGEGYQYAGDYKMALLCLEKAEIIINERECFELLDLKAQHMGKYYLELQKYELALDAFNEALKLRKEKNEIDLIDATEEAIEFCRLKIDTIS
ncbi:tetratricopeptide repeat protein [Salinicoccus albus]|uniref:tetratricopeptide repeat protein n=1 Tax=Salinicoccus albus TaxID=418756 RepID=UPI00036FB2AF|nr:tetratricopeptide repeat protein [Salinicoccus albus]